MCTQHKSFIVHGNLNDNRLTICGRSRFPLRISDCTVSFNKKDICREVVSTEHVKLAKMDSSFIRSCFTRSNFVGLIVQIGNNLSLHKRQIYRIAWKGYGLCICSYIYYTHFHSLFCEFNRQNKHTNFLSITRFCSNLFGPMCLSFFVGTRKIENVSFDPPLPLPERTDKETKQMNPNRIMCATVVRSKSRDQKWFSQVISTLDIMESRETAKR